MFDLGVVSCGEWLGLSLLTLLKPKPEHIS